MTSARSKLEVRCSTPSSRQVLLVITLGAASLLAGLVWGVGAAIYTLLIQPIGWWGIGRPLRSPAGGSTGPSGGASGSPVGEDERGRGAQLARLAHEIRTPLASIVGAAELLRETELDLDQADHARTILQSASRLLRVVDDLQTFSRMAAGELELECRELPLERCVREVVEGAYPLAAERGLELTYLIERGTPDRLAGDPARLQQVLANLLDSAVRCTTRGGVRLLVRQASAAGELRTIEFRVADTGPEVPPVRRNVPARRSSQGSDAAAEGNTEFGLAISRQLVELMGGELRQESAAAGDLDFHFTAALRGESAGAEEGGAEFAGQRLLVAEAGVGTRHVVRTLARACGMEVEETEEGERALQLLREAASAARPFHYILVGHDLPPLGGKDLATRIKSDQNLRSVRVLLAREPGCPERSHSLARAGVDAWVAKPLGATHLRHALRYLAAAAGDGGGWPIATDSEREKPPRPAAANRPRARVLLVEDNVVNQKVGSLLLKNCGCEVEVARDGREAVRKVGQKPYDIVFMDCLMPVMDGFEATRAIRGLGEGRQGSLPVIAMTAMAMDGDRIRCFEAGMNDYLSKPVQRDDLQAMLDKWLQHQSTLLGRESKMKNVHDHALDPEVVAALKGLGGEDDPQLFAELVALFLEDTPKRLQELTGALDKGDADGVSRAAHALKSSTANLGAMRLSDLFRQIEYAGREGKLEEVGSLVHEAEPEYRRVESALHTELD
ncbi:MAG: response regulator [Planctomycetota bacterium]